jgi:hypothetical protein
VAGEGDGLDGRGEGGAGGGGRCGDGCGRSVGRRGGAVAGRGGCARVLVHVPARGARSPVEARGVPAAPAPLRGGGGHPPESDSARPHWPSPTELQTEPRAKLHRGWNLSGRGRASSGTPGLPRGGRHRGGGQELTDSVHPCVYSIPTVRRHWCLAGAVHGPYLPDRGASLRGGSRHEGSAPRIPRQFRRGAPRRGDAVRCGDHTVSRELLRLPPLVGLEACR